MGAISPRPGGDGTHECASLQDLCEMRQKAQRRRAARLLELHAQLLLRVDSQVCEAGEEVEAMRYRVYNDTDLPSKEIRKLIKFAGDDLDFDRGVIYARVAWTQPQKKSRPYAAVGEAFWPVGMDLRIAKPERYPAPWYDRSYTGHAIGMIESWQEALVAMAAHELKHLAEYQRGCEARHRLMEGRCDAYAFSRLDAYRRTHEGGE